MILLMITLAFIANSEFLESGHTLSGFRMLLNNLVSFLSIGFSFQCCFVVVVDGSPEENHLLNTLLKDYDIKSRPVAHVDDILPVQVGVSLLQIIKVDEKSQTLTINVWLRLLWYDYKFHWNPEDHSNITLIRMTPELLWRPDIRLGNTAFEEYQDWSEGTNALVFPNGMVFNVPAVVLKSTCRMDVTWFPFDSQKCSLKFGSWTYSAYELDLQLYNISAAADLDEYLTNGEWEVLSITATRTEKFYKCCTEPYPTAEFSIHIKRRSLYYFFNLLVPCGLIGFLALLGFTLPPDSGEKLPLGVTVLFSLIVFLNMIAQTMPANSDAVPLLGTYFNCVMVMIALSVVSTIIVNLNQRAMNMKRIQGIKRSVFFNCLPWILRMQLPVHIGTEVESVSNVKEKIDTNQMTSIGSNGNGSLLNSIPGQDDASTGKKIDDILIQKEWRFVAIVVDRICLLISILCVLVATVVFLISAL